MTKKQPKTPKIWIGTSGWSYEHWKDNFYPKGLPSAQWLNYFGEHFPTVEVNSSFYRTPSVTTVKNWFAQVPETFLFSIKANRTITHRKRLKDCADSVDFFYKSLRGLKGKTGPLLFQLPPFFPLNMERFTEFIALLDNTHQHVFEFRHPTWFTDEIYDLLSKKRIALCITDLNGKLTPEEITAPFTYIRLHGPRKAYQGSYGPTKLRTWKKKIDAWAKDTSVYCYFDNDEKGFAVQDAKYLQTLFKN